MLDSSGKLTDGIFSGHNGAMGNIYECMDIFAKNDSSNIGEIRSGISPINLILRNVYQIQISKLLVFAII